MVFLNPSILLGLLAAAIPVLIHILNFRKLQRVEFSTLDFLKELQKSKIKKIKIKQWLLLLLRTLIIIFLVLAFARPTLESTYFSGAISTAKSGAAFIIDNSFSMSFVGNEGSIFNKSKAEAKKIISQMQNGDEFYFIVSNDSVLSTTDKESALKFIDNFQITLYTESLNKKIKKAITILNDSQNLNKEIFLFSDFQKSTFGSPIKNDSAGLKTSNNIKLYSFDMSLSDAGNYSISNLKLENSIIEINKPLTFSCLVNNFSKNSVNNITASLFLNDERVAQQSINLIAMEEKRIKFESTLKTAGLIEARVELEDDNINQDNSNYLAFFVPAKIKILIVYDDISDIKFLKAALGSSTVSNRFEVSIISSNSSTGIDYPLHDVVFLLSVKNDVLDNVKNYILSGGKLVIVPPGKTSMPDLQILSSVLNYPKAKSIVQTDKSNYAQFDFINFDHPVFQNLFSVKIKDEIESPKIFKYIKLNETQPVTSIITLNDKSVFLGEYKFGKGQVLFFNTAGSLAWSSFPIKGIFAPLINKIVYYLSSNNMVFNSYKIGEKIPLNLNNITYPVIKVLLPVGTDNINLEEVKTNIFNYEETFLAGSYKFYSNNKLVSFASVNTDRKESDLTKVEDKVKNNFFEKYFDGNYININSQEDYSLKIKQARYGTELWKPFLLAAFLFALIEMFIARNTKKDLTKIMQ